MNEFYNHSGYPTTGSAGASANMRAELDAIAAGFDKLPPLAGNALKSIRVNAAGTALEASNAVTIPVTSYVLKGDGAGGMATGTPGTDYLVPAAIGVTVQAYDATILKSAAIGVTVQGYDATTLKSADIGSSVQAYDANTVKKNVTNTYTAQQVPMNGALTDGTTINWDGATNGQVVAVTLAGNRTMNAPTNIQQNAMYLLRVKQDATGSRTLTWNAAYKFGTSGAPTLSTGANKVDFVSFVGGSGNTLECLGSRLDAV